MEGDSVNYLRTGHEDRLQGCYQGRKNKRQTLSSSRRNLHHHNCCYRDNMEERHAQLKDERCQNRFDARLITCIAFLEATQECDNSER